MEKEKKITETVKKITIKGGYIYLEGTKEPIRGDIYRRRRYYQDCRSSFGRFSSLKKE